MPVRVLDCTGSGSYSGVIAGDDWVAGKSAMRLAVANMSLGDGLSASVNALVAGAVAKGVTMVAAAGNSSADACQTSPVSKSSAIMVGATTMPAAVTEFLLSNATPNQVIGAGSGSPNRLVYSMAAGAPATPVVKTVAVSAITGKGAKSGKQWRASATVTVRQYDGYNFGAAVPGATVAGMFSPGGTATCVTGSTGSCTVTSGLISSSYTSSFFSVGNVTGSSLVYDASKNAVSSINVSRP